MTEAEWLDCSDVQKMVWSLRDKISARKLRLFACASCRTVWPLLSDFLKGAVVVGEAYIEGRISAAELGKAVTAVNRVRRKRNNLDRAVYDAIRSEGGEVATEVARHIAEIVAPKCSFISEHDFINGWYANVYHSPGALSLMRDALYNEHLILEASILRDIVGPSPFRPVQIEPEVMEWNDGVLPSAARRIYESRDFDALPALAEDLEAAGCCDDEILSHCRLPGPHVRGCWVIDLLAGKS